MSKAKILSLATAVPQYRYSQTEIAEWLAQILKLNPEKSAQLKKISTNCKVETRHSVLPNLSNIILPSYLGSRSSDLMPTTGMRNQLYKEHAPKLATKAASKAIEEWGGKAEEITHVIFISCTGLMAPGVECLLASSLRLKPTVDRLGINFMGCFGAFKGLSLASSLFQADQSRKILMVCTELCTLHLQSATSIDAMIANCLFSDGAAAAVIGDDPHQPGTWEIQSHRSEMIDNTLQDMSWDIGDFGFSIVLSNNVPKYIGEKIGHFSQQLLGNTLVSECAWAVHPGGKAILEAVQKSSSLTRDQLQASWDTLKNYGNMSSATFLFVLDQLRKSKHQHANTVGLAFGPGLSIEGIVLKDFLRN